MSKYEIAGPVKEEDDVKTGKTLWYAYIGKDGYVIRIVIGKTSSEAISKAEEYIKKVSDNETIGEVTE